MKYKWDIETIDNILVVLTDYVSNGSFASLKENVNYLENNGHAVLIRLTDYNRKFSGPFTYVDQNAYSFLKKTKLYGGELIISNVGANVGTVFLAPKLQKNMTLGPNAIMLKTKYNDLFYYYWFKSRHGKHAINSIISGSAQPKFNKTSFKKIKVPVPPLSRQNSIVNVLSMLDSKIELNNQIISTLEEIASTLFKRWFVDFEFPDENGNPYKSSGGKTVASELGEIPEGWETTKLGEVGKIQKGLSYQSKYLDPKRNNPKSIPFFSLSNFNIDETINLEKTKYYFGEYKEKDKVEEKDILIAMTDLTQKRLLLGSCIFVPNLNKEMIFSLDVAKFIIEKNIKNYIFNFMKLPKYKNQLENYATGTTVTRISIKDIQNIMMVYPRKSNLNEFNNKVDSNYKMISILRNEIDHLRELRDSLLPKLLSGEIEIPQGEDV